MKTKKKVTKNKIEKVASTPSNEMMNGIDPSNTSSLLTEIIVGGVSTTEQEVKIASFDGDFGRADINLLRDRVNEIIDYINKK